jgi:hypothetical protein
LALRPNKLDRLSAKTMFVYLIIWGKYWSQYVQLGSYNGKNGSVQLAQRYNTWHPILGSKVPILPIAPGERSMARKGILWKYLWLHERSSLFCGTRMTRKKSFFGLASAPLISPVFFKNWEWNLKWGKSGIGSKLNFYSPALKIF